MSVTSSPAPRVTSGGPDASPAADAALAGGEGREFALALTAGLGLLYAVLTVLHGFSATGAAREVMAPLAGISAAALLAGHVMMRRLPPASNVPEQWVHWIALVPVLNSVTQVVATGRLDQTTPLMLTIIGIGVGISSARAAISLSALSVAAWVVAVAAVSSLRTSELLHHGIQLGMATGLAALAHRVLAYRKRTLAIAKDRAEWSSAWFSTMFEASPVGVAVADADGRYVAVNAALCELLGRTEGELLGHSGVEFTHPDDRSGQSADQALLEQGGHGVARVEKRYVRPDGQIRWSWLSSRHVVGPDGDSYILKHVQDVTDHHDAEQAVRDSERNLAGVTAVARRIRSGEDARTSIVEALRELAGASSVMIVEREAAAAPGSLTAAKQARRAPDNEEPALVITASDDPALVGTPIPLSGTSVTADVYAKGTAVFLPDPELDPTFPEPVAPSQARSMLWQPVSVGGATRAVIAVTWDRRITSMSDQRAAAVALLANETGLALDHEALLARLEARANTDPLTGLTNRRAWDRTLDQLMEQARRTGRPLTIAIADLDRFKLYNDTHGHTAGDTLLAATAAAFQRSVRTTDLVARWGGEEFALALPDCPPANATEVLERVRRSVPQGQTCSIGYATWDTVETAYEFLCRADAALYASKNTGRNKITTAARPHLDQPPTPVATTAG